MTSLRTRLLRSRRVGCLCRPNRHRRRCRDRRCLGRRRLVGRLPSLLRVRECRRRRLRRKAGEVDRRLSLRLLRPNALVSPRRYPKRRRRGRDSRRLPTHPYVPSRITYPYLPLLPFHHHPNLNHLYRPRHYPPLHITRLHLPSKSPHPNPVPLRLKPRSLKLKPPPARPPQFAPHLLTTSLTPIPTLTRCPPHQEGRR